nr:DUF3237 domain-containing protein [Rhizobium leguminosarum]
MTSFPSRSIYLAVTTSKARFDGGTLWCNLGAKNRRSTVSLQSQHLFTLFIALHPTLELGQTPAGGRRIFPVSGGHFQGERLKGEVSPLIGSDLLLARTDGTFQQDVRLLLVADDGGLVLMTYRGIRRASQAVDGRLARGETVDASEYYLRTTPYFETAAPAHAWLNSIVAVAKGGRCPGGVEYEVFEVL